MPETLDFITLVPWTFVAMIANVYILYKLIRRFLFKPVQDILEKRQQAVDAIYDEANRTKSGAEQIKRQYDKKLSLAEAEAKAVVSSATDFAKIQEEEIIADAKMRARHIVDKAEADAEQIQRKAAVTLKDDISQMAIDIARKVVKREISPEEHNRLIEDCVNSFEEVE
ncbi:MAG: F0F1 ATP synthase subunit B [Eubacteriales bacterium]|nr:F0F1 ATP synthase subunit B [Eubacteriales bacterium]